MQMHDRPWEVRWDLVPVQLGLGSPWRIAAASVLLNRTRAVQAIPAMRKVFAAYPTPEALASADPWELSPLVHSCGFGTRRSRTLVALSRAWLGPWQDLRDLPGVGPYVADAVGLCVFGCRELVSRDKVLTRFAQTVKDER